MLTFFRLTLASMALVPALTWAQCEPELSWPSRAVGSHAVARPGRAAELVDAVIDFDSPLSQEITAFRQTQKDVLWDLYFRIYDRMVLSTPGYRDIFRAASLALPREGVIADYGYGTGNGLVFLKRYGPLRHLVGTEPSPIGRARASAKLAHDPDTLRGLHRQDFFDYELPDGSLDGALLVNVLYSLEPGRRLEALRRIHRHLKPGGVLVVNDPAAELRADRTDVVRTFANRFFTDAITEGARPSEYELALFAFLNIYALIKGNTFMDAAEFERLAAEAEFRILRYSRSYYGVGQLVVLEKK